VSTLVRNTIMIERHTKAPSSMRCVFQVKRFLKELPSKSNEFVIAIKVGFGVQAKLSHLDRNLIVSGRLSGQFTDGRLLFRSLRSSTHLDRNDRTRDLLGLRSSVRPVHLLLHRITLLARNRCLRSILDRQTVR
jgi:hypothetical protein